jgi:hypothetical protein
MLLLYSHEAEQPSEELVIGLPAQYRVIRLSV